MSLSKQTRHNTFSCSSMEKTAMRTYRPELAAIISLENPAQHTQRNENVWFLLTFCRRSYSCCWCLVISACSPRTACSLHTYTDSSTLQTKVDGPCLVTFFCLPPSTRIREVKISVHPQMCLKKPGTIPQIFGADLNFL